MFDLVVWTLYWGAAWGMNMVLRRHGATGWPTLLFSIFWMAPLIIAVMDKLDPPENGD